jgi:hypothetical protein
MKVLKAAIYTRVSTTDQHPEMQRNELLEYVKRRRWIFYKEYSDKGVPGRVFSPHLLKFLDGIPTKLVDGRKLLLFPSTEGLHRNRLFRQQSNEGWGPKLLQFYYSSGFSAGSQGRADRCHTPAGISKQKRNLWCREGESNPQGPKPGGF